jgi:hypothetical protein
LLALLGLASPGRSQLLNSERIEQDFGSYGIDVRYSDSQLRISNLYSLEDGARITRTLAIVGYPDTIDNAFADVHQTVLAGASIGASFRDAGWQVSKTMHSYFIAGVPVPVAEAMQIPPRVGLAAHAYRLAISQGRQHFDYALIIEIHHPDYLSLDDLRDIYGQEEGSGVPEPVRRLYSSGMEQFSRFGLALSE